jgi:hypothetical protein
MMTDETFLERLTAIEALSMDEAALDSFTSNYTALMLDQSRDHATLQNDNDRVEWEARKALLSNLIHAERAFVAGLYRERLEEGAKRGEGN